MVATIRALKMHGGVKKDALSTENVDALKLGLANLEASRPERSEVRRAGGRRRQSIPDGHAGGDRRWSLSTPASAGVALRCRTCGPRAARAARRSRREVLAVARRGEGQLPADLRCLPADRTKIETIAREIYGADGVDFSAAAGAQIEQLESIGMADTPVCMAKTQYSFSDDPTKLGRPRGSGSRSARSTPRPVRASWWRRPATS